MGRIILPKIDTVNLAFLKAIVSRRKAHMTKMTLERFEEFTAKVALSVPAKSKMLEVRA